MPSSKNAELHWRCRGAQHRFHSTSWYKDVKKLEDIVDRDRKKRCICQDIGISLLEVWYDEKPEIVIPNRIQKIKEFVCLVSKSFDIQTMSYKTLTPEYLDWHAKLTGLPGIFDRQDSFQFIQNI